MYSFYFELRLKFSFKFPPKLFKSNFYLNKHKNVEPDSPEVTDVLVALYIEISDDVVFFGGRVNNVVLVLREVDQVDPVLL